MRCGAFGTQVSISRYNRSTRDYKPSEKRLEMFERVINKILECDLYAEQQVILLPGCVSITIYF
jgi:hypothetical protein